MIATLDLKNMKGEIDAIASKSHAHRALIAASLADKPTTLLLNSTSNDIKATADCLKSAGAKIEEDKLNLTVSPIDKSAKEAVFDCGESGSTIRFLIPVAAALGINSVFTGCGRLPERPQAPLLNALSEHGVKVSPDGEFPIKISGKLTSGVFSIAGNISSQYVTGLLFALPLLDGDSEIRLIPPVESKPYIDMTAATLKDFGIEVNQQGNSYFIKGNQKYISPETVKIDGDWSNGAFFVSFGAVSDIKINGIFTSSVQGDKEIINIIKSMGADILQTENSISISKNKLHGIDIDVKNIPDLVPVIATLAVFAKGQTRIYNAGRLRLKESDRLATVTEIIRSAGGDIEELSDGLIINGGKPIKDSFTVDAENDHRLVMAAAVLASHSVVTVKNAQSINKSYPSFFEDLIKLGGKCDVINDR